MTRLAKTSLFGFLGLTVAFAGSTDVLACGRGGGGGYRGGYGGGYGGGISSSYYPSYSQPSHYRQPVYQQPVQPIVQQQPVQPVQQQFPQQQVQQQGFQQQTVAQQQIQSQPAQQQPVQSQPVQTAQTQQPQQVQAQPQQTQTQPAQTQPQTSSAQQSALQILAGFEGTDATETTATTPQPQVQAFTGIGTWSASLTNGSTVTLQLDADGTFIWNAVKSGKPSTFSGTYILNGGTLTLTRTDNQKLTGTLLAANTNGFTFKLDGVKDNGLQFARS